MTRAWRLLPLGGAAVLVLACRDFAPVNPYYPSAPQLTIEGPDTTYSDGQLLTYTFTTTQSWPSAAPVWTSSASGLLVPLGDGHFRVGQASYDGSDVVVRVTDGPYAIEKSVKVQQRPASLRFGYTNEAPPDSFSLSALEEAFTAVAFAYDSSGNWISLPANPPIAFHSLDTTIVWVVGNQPQSGLHEGRTWLVATYGSLRDSVPVRVQQVANLIDCSPSSRVYLAESDSVRLTVAAWRDATGHLMASPPVLTDFFLEQATTSSASVTSDGWVRTPSWPWQGLIGVHWRGATGQSRGLADGCWVYGGYPAP